MCRWIATFFCLITYTSAAQETHNMNDQSTLYLWENPAVFEQNRLPARAHFYAFSEDSKSYVDNPWESQDYQSLNGQWQFWLVDNPLVNDQGFQAPDFDDSQWGSIPVPGNWEVNGYGYPNYVNTKADWAADPVAGEIPHETNTTGRYRKVFSVPTQWHDGRVVIYFGAVKSAFKVWLNGQYVGYSQDSKTAAEFDLTDYLVDGENTLALEVYRWSDGSFLELQDMFRFTGIERDVYLYHTPKTYIQDIHTIATLDDNYQTGLLNINTLLAGQALTELKVHARLFDANEKLIWEQDTNATAKADDTQLVLELDSHFDNVQQWSAESPNLYTLQLSVIDAQGALLQTVWSRIGFRRSELKNGNVLINGKAVLFKGVNRHEHDPQTAHVITRESMRKDMELMKQLNMNSVRNSHYPNNPYWYALADELGMYVVDEANIESHGFGAANQGQFYKPEDHMVTMPHWQAAYIDRVSNMYEASKNHASVVILSIGNETGDGPNTEVLYHWLKQRSTLPVMSEQAQLRPHTDMYAQMYASIPLMEHFVELGSDRPMILCEYEHAMGNSVGNLTEYWQLIRKHKALQGGFIWDWVDQTIVTTSESGDVYAGYGGDFEPDGVYHDGNFSANGVLASDRTFNPHAYEVKYVYQDVQAELVDIENTLVKISNERFFTDLSDLKLVYVVEENGIEVQRGEVDSLKIAPQSDLTIHLPIELEKQAGKHYFINLSFLTKQASSVKVSGFEVAKVQLPFGFDAAEPQLITTGTAEVVDDTENLLTVSTDRGLFSFDKKSGWLNQWTLEGEELLAQPMVPWFWRAPTDNDFGEGFPTKAAIWMNIHEHAQLTSLAVSQQDNSVVIETEHYLPPVESRYQSRYRVFPNGNMDVSIGFLAAPNHFYPELPRIGQRLVVNPQYKEVNWFGRGPHESYWDRKQSAFISQYSLPIDDLGFGYVRPQENGHRSDVYQVTFSGRGLPGISAKSPNTIGFNAAYEDIMDYDTTEKRGLHPHEIPRQDKLHIHIDYKQRGIAGTDSWMTPPLFKYTLPWRDYFYEFSLTPAKQ